MKNNKQGFAAVFGIIIVLALLGGATYLYGKKSVTGPVACTMEAKLCPDGSSVGRTGPNCEFATCPGTSPVSPDNSFTTKPAPVVDETANWKTYTDKDYGFEIRYPLGWEAQLVQGDIWFHPVSSIVSSEGVQIWVVDKGIRKSSNIPVSAKQISSPERDFYLSGTPTAVLDNMVSTFRFTK